MNKKILSIALIPALVMIFSGIVYSEELNPDIFIKRFPQTYHVEIKVFPKRNTIKISKGANYIQEIYLPAPISNQYQTVSNLKLNQGILQQFKNSEENYFFARSNKPIQEAGLSFDVETCDLTVDFNKITTLFPYNKLSENYQRYTKSENKLIHLENKKIQNISDKIWKESKDYLDYTQRIYEFIITNLKWLNVSDSNLDAIFARKASDCGGLSSLFVSLLRAKGIPARYITGGVINKDGILGIHLWAEFYLEQYGWIPVDVSVFTGETYSYFGHESNLRLIFNRGSDFEVSKKLRIDILQILEFNHSIRSGKMTGVYELQKEVSVKIIKDSEKKEYYQSPAVIEKIKNNLLQLMNQARSEKGIKPLKITAKINEIAKRIMNNTISNKNTFIIKRMKKKGYEINGDKYFYYPISSEGLSPEKQVNEMLQPHLMDERYSEAGIDFYYNENLKQFQFFLFFTGTQ